MDCTAKDLFEHKGLLLKAKDWNRLSSDEDLGTVQVPAIDLYKASGESLVYDLTPPSDIKSSNAAGKITIRCFPATETHLKKYGNKQSHHGLRGFVSGIQSKAEQSMPKGLQDFGTKMQSMNKDLAEKMEKKLHIPFASKSGSSKKDDTEATSGGVPAVGNIIVEEDTPTKPPAATESTDRSATKQKEEQQDSSGQNETQEEPNLEEEEPEAKTSRALPPAPKDLKILIEIVAGRNLMIGDKTSSDPYVKVMLGDKEVHKTNHIVKT